MLDRGKLPFVPQQIGLLEHRRVRYGLAQQFRGNIVPAGEQEGVHFLERSRL